MILLTGYLWFFSVFKKTINTIYNQGSFYTDDPTGSEMN
jgi:hypothetical protein